MTKTVPKKERKNYRLDADLMTWAEGYAKRKKTSVTQVITDQLVALREREGRRAK